jgi:Ca2+-binding EF-hand superfamily protein
MAEAKPPKPAKKGESLEIRLSHATKQAFMTRCRQQGHSASAVVRRFIEDYLAAQGIVRLPQRSETRMASLRKGAHLASATTAGLIAVGALTLASVTSSSAWPDLRATFAELDGNADGSISPEEFLSRSKLDVFVKRPNAEMAPSDRTFMLPIDGPPPDTKALGTAFKVFPAPAERLEAEFKASDGDGSGGITFAEFKARHESVARLAFASLDQNANGMIERAEYEAATIGHEHVRRIFTSLDANHDGVVTAAEFVKAE